MRRIAIFDIDGTIFRSSLVIELTEALIESGLFPRGAQRAYERDYKNWLDRRGEYGKYIDAVVKTFGKHIAGLSVERVNKISERVVETHRNRVYRYTRDLVKELRRKKYYIIALSYSPLHIVSPFARKFGFHQVVGTTYESENGKFTGRQSLPAPDKAKILNLALKKSNFSLRGSVGVGDTESDIPFLKMVANPICFNPNLKLYKAARQNGWKVVVERKDVVYFLD